MTDHADYFEIEAVSASALKQMAVSPKHYLHGLTNSRPDTPAMRLGRATHTAVLEPDLFPLEYAVWDGARRGKEYEAFVAACNGKTVLTADEYGTCLAIRDAVRSHPVAAAYLGTGFAEQTITWTDAATGFACKCRPDWLAHRAGTIVDLKTTRDISERAFSRTIHDLNYHMAAGHYLSGVSAVMPLDADGYQAATDWMFVFIAVESSPPFDVRVGPLSEDALWCGQQEAARLLRRVAECTASGVWPGQFPDEAEFDLPAWYYAQGEKELEGLA